MAKGFLEWARLSRRFVEDHGCTISSFAVPVDDEVLMYTEMIMTNASPPDWVLKPGDKAKDALLCGARVKFTPKLKSGHPLVVINTNNVQTQKPTG